MAKSAGNEHFATPVSQADSPSIPNPNRERVTLSLSQSHGKLRTGDVLLYRPGPWNLVGRVIAAMGRGQYSHAALLDCDRGGALVLEVKSHGGGQESYLADQVRRWPGRIDLYRVPVREQYYRRLAVYRMRRFIGCEYGWWSIVRVALRHMPLVRLFMPPLPDFEQDKFPPFCSESVSLAMQAGALDPVPNLAPRLTEPDDLSRSHALEYQGTLFP